MLTGRLPFVGDTAHAVMFQIASADPLAMPDADKHLSAGIMDALRKALAKNPQDRYPTCAAFVRALAEQSAAAAQDSEAATVKVAALPSTPAPAPAAAVPLPVVSQSNPPWLLIGVLLMLLVLAVGGFWIYKSKHGAASGTAAVAADSTPAQTDPPLMKAIEEGRMDDARNLVAKGADVNQSNQNGLTALMVAASGSMLPDNVPAVKMLLDKNATIDAQDKRGETALYHAIADGKQDAALVLLDAKANPNLKNVEGATPLFASVEYGRMPILKTLLERGGDFETADANGTTPLMRASEGTPYMPNNTPLVQVLLDKGAKLETQDVQGRTALNRAASEGKTDVVRILLDKKANINTRTTSGATPLLNAVSYGKQPTIQLLLERGADVNQADAQGNTPLMAAADSGPFLPNSVPVLTMLIGAKAKIDLQDGLGRTALYRASAEGKEEAVRFLLDHGADVNLAEANGSTPLMVVAEGASYPKGQGETIALLLKHGAKTELKNSGGQTALDKATEAKKTEAIQLLQKK
jgi:uncharacterized protein